MKPTLVETLPGTIFTILTFLCGLLMCPIIWSVALHLAGMTSREKHYILFGPFVSYEESEIEGYCPDTRITTLHFLPDL
jgi:hypothetical protein